MGMYWFRFYSEAISDKKLRRVARLTGQNLASVLGIWAIMLSIASESPERGKLYISEDTPATADDIADFAGCNVTETLQQLHDIGLVTTVDGVICVVAWEKRQYESDNSTPRVKRHRERQKMAENAPDVTDMKRYSNVTVTPPDNRLQITDTIETNNNDKAGAPVDADVAAAMTAFQNDIHLVASPIQAQEMTDIIDRLKARNVMDWWHMAVKIACDNNARSWAYVRAVLENALKDGKPPGTNKPRMNGNGRSKPVKYADSPDSRDGYRVPEGYEDMVNVSHITIAAPDPWRDLLAEADALAVTVRETPQVKGRTLTQLTRKLDGMLGALPVPYDDAVRELAQRLQ